MHSYLINTYRLGECLLIVHLLQITFQKIWHVYVYLFIHLFKNVLIWGIKDIPKGQLALLATVERQQ